MFVRFQNILWSLSAGINGPWLDFRICITANTLLESGIGIKGERESWIGGKRLELMPKIIYQILVVINSFDSKFWARFFYSYIIKPPFELANAQQSFVNSIVEVDLI